MDLRIKEEKRYLVVSKPMEAITRKVLKEMKKKKVPNTPLQSAKIKLWKVRSLFYRQRDADWRGYAKCFTCSEIKNWKYEGDAGHYIKSTHDYTTLLLTEDRNVHFQCKGCNHYQSGAESEYAVALIARYGENVLQELNEKKHPPSPKKWKLQEILDLIEEYKEKVEKIKNKE